MNHSLDENLIIRTTALVIAGCAVAFLATLLVVESRAGVQEQRPVCDAQKFKIVIDVGHTPQSSGAISATGIPEYAFNTNLAIKIVASLLNAGFEARLLKTEGSGSSQLFERTARANQEKPDLFLSVHHDSVQPQYLESWDVGGEKRLYSDKFSGYSIFVASNNSFSAASLEFAKLLSSGFLSSGLSYSLHHAYNVRGESRLLLDANRGIFQNNELVVLKDTNAPAILLEAGIIVNRSEETSLKSADTQSKIGQAVVSAAKEFCLLQHPPK